MVESTLLVTKPGALTYSEAATVQIPTVLYSPIPGQEEANATYMQSKGCARWVKTSDAMVETVAELLDDPAELGKMSQACMMCHRDGARIVGQGSNGPAQP